MGIPAALGAAAAGLPNSGDQANAVLSGVISGVGPTPAFAFRGPMNLAIWASVVTALTTTTGSLAATVASATGLAAGAAINSVNLPRGTTVGALAGTNVTLAPAPRTHPGVFLSNGQVSGSFPTDRLLGATITIPSNATGVTLPANTTVAAIAQAFIPATLYDPGQPGIIQLSANPTTLPAVAGPVPFQATLTGNGIVVTGADAAASFTGASVTWAATVQLERSFDGGKTYSVCNIGGSGTLAQWLNLASVQITFGEPEKNVLYRLNCIQYTSGTINYRISQTGGAAESLAIGPLSSG